MWDSIKGARFRALSLSYRGTTFECPICEGHFRAFRLPHRACPGCGSFPRHRLLWLYIQQRLGIGPGTSVLHVAPEYGIERRLRSLGADYVSGDLERRAMLRLDVQELPFEDERFNVAICNHVLTYVPDEERAIRELRRVLDRRGRLLTQNPVDYSAEQSYEGPGLYGRRRFGRDLLSKLERAGFGVVVARLEDLADERAIAYYGLTELSREGQRGNDVYDCTRS